MEQVSGHDVGPIYPNLYNYPKKTILLPSDWRNLGGIWQNPTFPNNSGSIDSGVAELVIWALAKRLRWLGPVWLGDCFDRRWGEDTSPSFLPFLAGDETFLAQKNIMVAWRQRNRWRVWTTAYEMDCPYKRNMDFADSKNPKQPERNIRNRFVWPQIPWLISNFIPNGEFCIWIISFSNNILLWLTIKYPLYYILLIAMEPDWNGPQVTMIWGNPYNLGTPIEYVNMFHQSPRWTMKITTMKITNINHHSPPWSTMIRDLNNIPMLSIISLKSSSGSFRQVRQAEFRRRFRPGNKKREVETATFSTGGWTLKIRVVSTLWMSTELAIEWEINDQ